MRKFVTALGVLVLLAGGCKPKTTSAQVDTLNTLQEVEKKVIQGSQDDFCSRFTNNSTVWRAEFYAANAYLVRGNGLDSIRNSIEKLILAWNESHPLKIKFVKTKKDTLFVSIPDATYLVQQIGSTMSNRVLAELVFTLTENEKYPYVYIDVIESDHSGGGLYSRKLFYERGWKYIICK